MESAGVLKPGEAKAMTVLMGVSSFSSAVGAALPMSPAAPVRLNLCLAVLGAVLGVLAWARPARLWSHVGVCAMVGGLGLLTTATATPAGTAALGMSFTWAAAFAAFFLPRPAARAYALAAVASFGMGLLVNPFSGAAHVWFLTSVTTLVGAEAVATLVGRLDRAAVTDPLTGLLNRTGLQRRADAVLAGAARTGRPVSVVVLDLDGFKGVNDRDGHEAGDRLLAELAASWRAQVRSEDVLARLGGDEFVLVLPDATAADAHELLARLTAVSPAPWSCGTAVSGPGSRLRDLLLEADRALYAAKAQRPRELVLPGTRSAQPVRTAT